QGCARCPRAKTGPYYQRVDSLHNTFKPPSGGFTRSTGSDGGRAGLMENRQSFYETLLQLRANNKTARDSAVILLKEPQKKKAYDMLEKQLKESDKMRHSPGREGGMSGGRRGPPPSAQRLRLVTGCCPGRASNVVFRALAMFAPHT